MASSDVRNSKFDMKTGSLAYEIYEAAPQSSPTTPPVGLVVVIQEIFGVNSHIRDVTDRFAKEGYLAWAPAYFDPIEKGVELGYGESSFPKGRELITKLGFDNAVAITRACAEEMKKREPGLKLATVGFCWGGSVAWLSATRIGEPLVNHAVSYYGRMAIDFRNEKPMAPVMAHWGEHDPSIPMENVCLFEQAQPSVRSFTYDAGHGFNCDQRDHFDAVAAAAAWKRTLEFIGS